MQYIINRICEIISEREPALGSEEIVLVNGFESLTYYAELSTLLKKSFTTKGKSFNIKLAKRKWEELSSRSSSHSVQLMKQEDWVADKESVTYYRNQHDVDILVLLGTEDEEDIGGLANCFTISPDKLIQDLEEDYYKILKPCFTYDLTEDDIFCVNKAYRDLFEYLPVDICKLSDIADDWFKNFDSINEFCETFGNNLISWELPNRQEKPLKPNKIKAKGNCLKGEKAFISGKLFQKMSQKAYAGLEKKLEKYATEGAYSSIDFNIFDIKSYNDLKEYILEFARGENVQANREKLLKVDYSIIDDILKIKLDGSVPTKVTETSLSGEPLVVVFTTLLSAIKAAKDANLVDVNEIRFSFSSASLVTGYTDVDDDEKTAILAETWRNICIHVNGIFDFINRNEWKAFSKSIKVTCDSNDFFDPAKVTSQLSNTVNVATGTNTLNKIYFSVSIYDNDGNLMQEIKNGVERDRTYYYAWKFNNEAPWLFDFKDLSDADNITTDSSRIVPIAKMRHIKNAMVIKSAEEFFDILSDDPIDLTFDLIPYINKRTSATQEYAIKEFCVLFDDLGKAFCKFASKVTKEGFYKYLCSDEITVLNDAYIRLANKILQYKFAENQQWIKAAYLQSFVIEESTEYISEDQDPECVIIPPWHPAALQKIAAQKNFIIDGLSQKIASCDIDGIGFSVESTIDRFVRMTEIQSSIDLFPTGGNDYMGVIGTYGNYCVYGNEKNVSTIKTRVKDILRKEAIYDEEFKASELTKMNDDAKMIFDVISDYNKAMPSVQCTLKIVFINPPDLQPIISAISKYVRDLHKDDEELAIDLQLSILVRPENKGGKNYLTYWMDEYFSEEKNTSVKIYLNEWSSKPELDKLIGENNDIVFNMDFLHAETFRFIPNPGTNAGKVTDCRFPIVYKPSPLSKTSKKRKIELTQTQFSAAYKHAQVARYSKNPELIPVTEYLAVRETSVETETKQIIDMLHKKAYWVVCIDKAMDGALLRGDDMSSQYAIIGFSTGKGMYGQYNLTITARNSILETVEKKLKDRLYRLFTWDTSILDAASKRIMDEARDLDGISMLSAINQKGTNINEFMAYVMTSLRERQNAESSALKVIIHLDSYKHWFDNSSTSDSSMRPDFLMLSVKDADSTINLKAEIIECKTAAYKNYNLHTDKASKQVLHGLDQLQRLFDPNSSSIERRYWYAQLYRALVFAQVTFSDSSTEFSELSGKLRAILDGDFSIEWDGKVLGYWVDMPGKEEVITKVNNVTICNIPQQRIQSILTDDSSTEYIDIKKDILDTVDDGIEDEIEKETDLQITEERKEILERRKSTKSYENDNSPTEDNSEKSSDNQDTTNNEPVYPEIEQHQNLFKEAPTKSLDEARVLIGKDKGENNVFWEFGNKGLSNRHLLITGTSGQGKTYCIQTMLYELSKTNTPMVVFDYTEGFRKNQLEQKFLDKMGNRIDEQIVYVTGVPIDPFKRHEIDIAGIKTQEKTSDVAQRIASTLSHVYGFGEQQFAAIYMACITGLKKYGSNMNMQFFESELNSSDNKAAKTVVSKMMPFLHSVEFSENLCNWEDILYNSEGRLTIFQLTNFVRDIQVIITEFMLWDMWHYTKKNGNKDKPFAVVLDEAQNLSHEASSPSGLILTEGRKFGWSAWYATQSLKVLNDDEITRLMQSAFKLYFKPTDYEIISMAKQLDPNDPNYWRTPLSNLKKGECIVVGDRIQKDGLFKSGKPTLTKVSSFDNR